MPIDKPTARPKMVELPRRKLKNVKNTVSEQISSDLTNIAVDTFADYHPSKLNISNAKSHPDAVVETASLSLIPPADISYKLSIPDITIEEGRLSALQLKAIVYAVQMHEKMLPNDSRAGFLVGMISIEFLFIPIQICSNPFYYVYKCSRAIFLIGYFYNCVRRWSWCRQRSNHCWNSF